MSRKEREREREREREGGRGREGEGETSLPLTLPKEKRERMLPSRLPDLIRLTGRKPRLLAVLKKRGSEEGFVKVMGTAIVMRMGMAGSHS